MADIQVRVDAENALTIFTVEGSLTADEIFHYSSEYYGRKPTRLVLWDVSRGSVGGIRYEEFQLLACRLKNCLCKREGGKTAFIGKFDLDFALGRMYEHYAEFEHLPVRYCTFRSADQAKEWLLTPDMKD